MITISTLIVACVLWSLLSRRAGRIEQEANDTRASLDALEKAQERQRREQERAQARIEREQEKQRREQERQAREQERQARQLERHEEQIARLEMRLSAAESEIAFNREQRERLFELLNIEERERDATVYGGKEWAKHHQKVISLEGRIHTVQNRLDKAKMDKAYCESKLEVA